MSADPATRAPRRSRLGGAGRVIAFTVTAAFLALLAYGLLLSAPDRTIDDSLARAETVAAPSFRLGVLDRGSLGPRLTATLGPALADGELASEELRGHPYVLNFWASWCIPCREEAPLIEQTWRTARDRGRVLFLGLNMQDLQEDARDFLRDFDIDYLNIRDPSNEVARRFGVTGLPETFFVSAGGDVVAHVVGVISAEQLAGGLGAAIAGRPTRPEQGGDRRPTR